MTTIAYEAATTAINAFPRVEISQFGQEWQWTLRRAPKETLHCQKPFPLAEDALANAMALAAIDANAGPVFAPIWVIESLAAREAVLDEADDLLSRGFGLAEWDEEHGETADIFSEGGAI